MAVIPGSPVRTHTGASAPSYPYRGSPSPSPSPSHRSQSRSNRYSNSTASPSSAQTVLTSPTNPSPSTPNAHPYAIKTTSTALLSRSSSSAAQSGNAKHRYIPPSSPISPPSGTHGIDDEDMTSDSQNNRGSMGMGRKGRHRYSRSLTDGPLPVPIPPGVTNNASNSYTGYSPSAAPSYRVRERAQTLVSESEEITPRRRPDGNMLSSSTSDMGPPLTPLHRHSTLEPFSNGNANFNSRRILSNDNEEGNEEVNAEGVTIRRRAARIIKQPTRTRASSMSSNSSISSSASGRVREMVDELERSSSGRELEEEGTTSSRSGSPTKNFNRSTSPSKQTVGRTLPHRPSVNDLFSAPSAKSSESTTPDLVGEMETLAKEMDETITHVAKKNMHGREPRLLPFPPNATGATSSPSNGSGSPLTINSEREHQGPSDYELGLRHALSPHAQTFVSRHSASPSIGNGSGKPARVLPYLPVTSEAALHHPRPRRAVGRDADDTDATQAEGEGAYATALESQTSSVGVESSPASEVSNALDSPERGEPSVAELLAAESAHVVSGAKAWEIELGDTVKRVNDAHGHAPLTVLPKKTKAKVSSGLNEIGRKAGRSGTLEKVQDVGTNRDKESLRRPGVIGLFEDEEVRAQKAAEEKRVAEERTREVELKLKEVEEKRRELEVKVEEIAARSKDVDATAKVVEQLREEIIAKEHTVDARSKELEIKAKKIEEHREEIMVKKHEVDERSRELESRAKKLEEDREEIVVKEHKVDERSRELDARTREIAAEREAIVAKEQEIAERTRDVDISVKKIEEDRTDILAKQREVVEQSRELETGIRKIEEDRAKIIAQELEVNERFTEVQSQIQKLEHDRVQITTKEHEVDERSRELELRANKIEEDRQELVAKKREVDEQSREVELRMAKVEEDRILLATKERQVDERSRELQTKANKIEEDRQEISTRQHQVDEQSREVVSRMEKLEEDQKSIATKEHEVDERSRELDSRTKKLEAERDEIVLKEAALFQQSRDIDISLKNIEEDRAKIVAKEHELVEQSTELEARTRKFEEDREELVAQERQVVVRFREAESKMKKIEEDGAELMAKENEAEEVLKDIEARAKHVQEAQLTLDIREHSLVSREEAVLLRESNINNEVERRTQSAKADLDLKAQRAVDMGASLQAHEEEVEQRTKAVASRETDALEKEEILETRKRALHEAAENLEAAKRQLNEREQSIENLERELTTRELRLRAEEQKKEDQDARDKADANAKAQAQLQLTAQKQAEELRVAEEQKAAYLSFQQSKAIPDILRRCWGTFVLPIVGEQRTPAFLLSPPFPTSCNAQVSNSAPHNADAAITDVAGQPKLKAPTWFIRRDAFLGRFMGGPGGLTDGYLVLMGIGMCVVVLRVLGRKGWGMRQ